MVHPYHPPGPCANPQTGTTPLAISARPCHTNSMENNETAVKFLESTPQEQLAYAWAVAQSSLYRSSQVSERLLNRCREAAYQLSVSDALMMLAEVPDLVVP